MTEHTGADYYCAQRDSQGNIRLECGRGLLVANADHTRADVQGWFDRSKPGSYREQYRAALALFDEEERERADRRTDMVGYLALAEVLSKAKGEEA